MFPTADCKSAVIKQVGEEDEKSVTSIAHQFERGARNKKFEMITGSKMKESNQRPVEAKSAGASPVGPAINFTEGNEGDEDAHRERVLHQASFFERCL